MAWLRHPALAGVAVLLFVLGMGNFFWFAREYGQLGGGAANGYVQDGRYFVGDRGVYREVSREAWEASQLHQSSLLISHPLAMLSAGYLLIGWFFPLGMGRARPDTPQRIAQVRASGPPLASTWCGARLGWVNVRGPLLKVSAHPGGVVFHSILLPTRAIPSDELLSVEYTGPRFGGMRAGHLTIRHTAPDLGATVILYVSDQSELAAAIRSLAPA